jgi:hypothetical protein
MRKIITLIIFMTFTCFVIPSISYGDIPLSPDVIKLAGNIYEIHLRGKNENIVFLIGMQKCALVTLENGYEYFYIVDYAGNVKPSYQYIPQIQTTIYKSSS